jgi:hypothetical protein
MFLPNLLNTDMKTIPLILCTGLFLLPACGSKVNQAPLFNKNASLPALFKFSDAGLKLSTSFIDEKSGSMSVLYTKGQTLTLITWKQKSDEYWFGANVPDELQSVEIVKTTASPSGLTADYKKYNNKGLLMRQDTAWQRRRTSYILDQQPSFMP